MIFFTKKGTYDFLVVGLGNPGPKYENTRHNAGFMAVDAIANHRDADFKKTKWNAMSAECSIGGERILLLKPLTFMNNSGEAVSAVARFYKIPAERIIVLFDDVSLAVGRLRIRRSGSDGGHNGMKDIIQLMGSDNIPRVKIGVGEKPHPDYDLKDWVLSSFKKDEEENLKTAVNNAVSAVFYMVAGQTDVAMNKFNKK